MNFLKKHWRVIVCVVIGVFLCASVFAMHGQFNSPDERAYNEMIRSSVAGQGFSIDAPPENAWLSYPLFPRSMQPVGTEIKPVGFVGLPFIYGIIAGFAGNWIVVYLTIIAFFVGAWGWWQITKEFFGKEIAQISVWLYVLHPALLYYTVRGLYPNVLLVSAVIFAIAAALQAYQAWGKNWQTGAWAIASLLSAAVAILVRPPEAFVVFALVAGAAYLFGTARIKLLGKFSLITFFVLGGIGWFMRHVGALSGAYPFLRDSSPWGILFPFGIHLRLVAHNVWRFIFKLFWPWMLLFAAGIILERKNLFAIQEWSPRMRAFIFVAKLSCLWLFLAYGSWQLADNPSNAAAVTIGISYVRYWLLFFIMATPFMAMAIVKQKKYIVWIFAILILCSAWRVWTGVDGLGAVIAENRSAAVVVPEVQKLLPPGTVLAVRTWDKHFFPVVPVLQPFPQEMRAVTAAHELLTHQVPVFAFIDTAKDVDLLWLATNNLHVRLIKTFGNQSLYELTQ